MTDPFDDTDIDDDPQMQTISVEMLTPLAPTQKPKVGRPKDSPRTQARKVLTRKEREEGGAIARDLPLWSETLPDYKEEAKFHGNLGLRFLKNITATEILKMPVRDRVASAKISHRIRDALLARPAANIDFGARRSRLDALQELQQELARRERERATIDITPEKKEH